ncbi:MAG: YebG family protein [Gammaproteobacteria bacterium]|nr:YebG family protein [Gammaproteobacteria bacterium]
MAVLAKWLCDRDGSMFDSKKDAEAHDKVLELAEQFTELLIANIPGVNSQKAEQFGLLLANNKDQVIEACKGNVSALSSLGVVQGEVEIEEDNVTRLVAEA